jgi:hypothetical protein
MKNTGEFASEYDQAAEAHHDKGGQGTTIVAFSMKNFKKIRKKFFS